jgi:phage-related protein
MACLGTTMMITVIDDQNLHAGSQTISSDTNPVLVLEGTGKGTITCSNNDDLEE